VYPEKHLISRIDRDLTNEAWWISEIQRRDLSSNREICRRLRHTNAIRSIWFRHSKVLGLLGFTRFSSLSTLNINRVHWSSFHQKTYYENASSVQCMHLVDAVYLSMQRNKATKKLLFWELYHAPKRSPKVSTVVYFISIKVWGTRAYSEARLLSSRYPTRSSKWLQDAG
jgi:hypothetical protein